MAYIWKYSYFESSAREYLKVFFFRWLWLLKSLKIFEMQDLQMLKEQILCREFNASTAAIIDTFPVSTNCYDSVTA